MQPSMTRITSPSRLPRNSGTRFGVFYYEVSPKLSNAVTTDGAVGRCDWIQGATFLGDRGLPEESLIGERAFLSFLPPHALPTFGRDRATRPRSGCFGCGPVWANALACVRVCVCSSEATKEFEIAKMGPIPSFVVSSHVREGQYALSVNFFYCRLRLFRSFFRENCVFEDGCLTWRPRYGFESQPPRNSHTNQLPHPSHIRKNETCTWV